MTPNHLNAEPPNGSLQLIYVIDRYFRFTFDVREKENTPFLTLLVEDISPPSDFREDEPISPPQGSFPLPHTFAFKGCAIGLNLYNQQGMTLSGSMTLTAVNLPNQNHNTGIWCDLEYGWTHKKHFEGVMHTFTSSFTPE